MTSFYSTYIYVCPACNTIVPFGSTKLNGLECRDCAKTEYKEIIIRSRIMTHGRMDKNTISLLKEYTGIDRASAYKPCKTTWLSACRDIELATFLLNNPNDIESWYI